MKISKNHLAAIAFPAQLGICWATVLAVKHLDYNYSNMLYPFLLRLQAAIAEALRPLLGDSMGLTAIILATVFVSVVALVAVHSLRSNKRLVRLMGYTLIILLVLSNVLWFSTSDLKRCC